MAQPRCPGCGVAIDDPGRFCPSCGSARDLTDELATAATAAPSAAPLGSGPPPTLIGQLVGDLRIEAVIGSGSFGTVYRARQLGLDRLVAVKVPTHEIAADPVQALRFAREARAAARVVHPGVVAIHAIGELDDGRPYLAMQLVEGVPLDEILERGAIDVPRALGIARDIASALSETHAAGVIHRDLKPSNIMWRRDRNGDDRITIVDFGIAVCRVGHADATRLTTGGLIGTPHYMSPEQAHGEEVDGRADLYALGCLLFELVTGGPPYEGSGVEVLLAHLSGPPPSARRKNPELPREVDALIQRLMAKSPVERPATADAVVALLDDAIATCAPRRARATTAPAVARRRWPWAALFVAAALSGAWAWTSASRGEDAAEPAVVGPGLRSASGELLRQIASDDGELILRTTVPATIRVGAAIQAHIEIRTKLGGTFNAKQVVVTIEDPRGRASAQTAAIHGGHAGHYVFRHTFAAAGRHIVRIFPSESETVTTLELEVVP